MTQIVEAVYENGMLRPVTPIAGLRERQHVQISIESEKPPHPLLKHCGTVSDKDTAEIQRIIEDEFEKVDPNDWNDLALDTSAAVQLLNDAALASRFLSRVGRVHLPAVAAGELFYGALNSTQHATNVPRYRQFIENCVLLPVTMATAEIYATTRMKLKANGHPIPDSDLWIAAAAIEHQLPMVTTDKHFTYVADLKLEPLGAA